MIRRKERIVKRKVNKVGCNYENQGVRITTYYFLFFIPVYRNEEVLNGAYERF